MCKCNFLIGVCSRVWRFSLEHRLEGDINNSARGRAECLRYDDIQELTIMWLVTNSMLVQIYEHHRLIFISFKVLTNFLWWITKPGSDSASVCINLQIDGFRKSMIWLLRLSTWLRTGSPKVTTTHNCTIFQVRSITAVITCSTWLYSQAAGELINHSLLTRLSSFRNAPKHVRE
jgi:hypothetical protein